MLLPWVLAGSCVRRSSCPFGNVLHSCLGCHHTVGRRVEARAPAHLFLRLIRPSLKCCLFVCSGLSSRGRRCERWMSQPSRSQSTAEPLTRSTARHAAAIAHRPPGVPRHGDQVSCLAAHERRDDNTINDNEVSANQPPSQLLSARSLQPAQSRPVPADACRRSGVRYLRQSLGVPHFQTRPRQRAPLSPSSFSPLHWRAAANHNHTRSTASMINSPLLSPPSNNQNLKHTLDTHANLYGTSPSYDACSRSRRHSRARQSRRRRR